MTADLLMTMLKEGGLIAVAAFATWAWLMERKESRAMREKVLQLAVASVEANTKTEATLVGLKGLLEQILSRM